MTLTVISLSPHHSINKIDSHITERVHLSCEKGKMPYSAFYFRYPKTQGILAWYSELDTPTRFYSQTTSLSAGHPTLFPPGSIWRELGFTSFQEHVPRMLSWATFESKHDSCLHQQDHVKVGAGSLLRNIL